MKTVAKWIAENAGDVLCWDWGKANKMKVSSPKIADGKGKNPANQWGSERVWGDNQHEHPNNLPKTGLFMGFTDI